MSDTLKEIINQNTTVLWSGPDNKTAVILTKGDKSTLALKIGDFITFTNRPDGVIITEFSYKDSDSRGPTGMYYTPWRKETNTWASPKYALRGDMRHIIAFPCGAPHYGEQLNWNTVALLNNGVIPAPWSPQ